MVKRVILVILDSLGVGALPDAAAFNDIGAATLPHIHTVRGGLNIPNLCTIGMGEIVAIGCAPKKIVGSFGRMAAQSSNKDTTSGHWEIAGLVLKEAFPTYPSGFPAEIVRRFEQTIGKQTLGNYARSGTLILEELGTAHLETGSPIIYTSADSVFQIAAHETITPTGVLYDYCRAARKILKRPHAVGRVIARPFKGDPGAFERKNSERKDFSIEPPAETLLDRLQERGLFTVGIGKIGDIFGHKGLSEEIHSQNNLDGVRLIREALSRYDGQRGLIFVNLVDFDVLYGHRRNVEGYAAALEEFDRELPGILEAMSKEDVLIITADHGCDPTYEDHTDHTREYVPLLVYGEHVKPRVNLGTRQTFADCGQTIADLLGAGMLQNGVSYRKDIIDG
jgi:phosphopentomutase